MQYLVKGDQIGAGGRDYLCQPANIQTVILSGPAMDVIRHDPDCCRHLSK
jgi:hypothetical protein